MYFCSTDKPLPVQLTSMKARAPIGILDPNMIPPSPPLSALQRLSHLEPPPSASSSVSRTPTPTAPQPLPDSALPASVPRSITNPVPDLTPTGSLLFQKASSHTSDPPRADTPSSRASTVKPRSKLFALASSRASSSSRSSATFSDSSLSAVTYPNLRPSAESVLSGSGASEVGKGRIGMSTTGGNEIGKSDASKSETIRSESRRSASGRSRAARSEASRIDDTGGSDTGSSSMSSHVRRAIETALQLEAVDQVCPSRQLSPPMSEPRSPSFALQIPRGIQLPASPLLLNPCQNYCSHVTQCLLPSRFTRCVLPTYKRQRHYLPMHRTATWRYDDSNATIDLTHWTLLSRGSQLADQVLATGVVSTTPIRKHTGGFRKS